MTLAVLCLDFPIRAEHDPHVADLAIDFYRKRPRLQSNMMIIGK